MSAATGRIGIINAHMLGTDAEPGEHVDWNEPDYFTPEEFAYVTAWDPASYAQENPHMILWEA